MVCLVEKINVEHLILATYINNHYLNELDQMEVYDYIMPYELLSSNKTIKLVAKAIFNLQELNKPLDDTTIYSYITKHININQSEFLEILAHMPVTYDIFIKYITHLKEMNEEEKLKKRLREI